jgi:hypothetical protein
MKFDEIVWIFFLIMFVLLACWADNANAEMTKDDIELEIAWQAVHVADTLTTLDIKNHDNIYELNVFMGEHPKDSRVYCYMLTSAIFHFCAVSLLPEKLEVFGFDLEPKKNFQRVSFGISGNFVANNLSIGLGFDF